MTPTTWTPAGGLAPGQYFKLNGQWRLCVDKPHHATDGLPYPWTVRTARPSGHVGIEALHANRVQAAPIGVRPDAFSPASLRRKAASDEHQAGVLLDTAGKRRRLAQKLESGAVIS